MQQSLMMQVIWQLPDNSSKGLWSLSLPSNRNSCWGSPPLFLIINLSSNPQLNHSSTQTQRNITLIGLDMKMTLHTHPTPRKHNVSNISALTWLDFDETLKLGSWELLEEIAAVMVTFVQVQATFVPMTFVHFRNIFSVTKDFDYILKVCSLDHLLTDANHHNDICPGNIYPGDICTYP